MSVLFIANNVGLVNVVCKNAGILYRGKMVEEGPSEQVIHTARHPYTQTLISAIPRDKSEKLRFASMVIKPEAEHGCPYYSRCGIARERLCPERAHAGRGRRRAEGGLFLMQGSSYERSAGQN